MIAIIIFIMFLIIINTYSLNEEIKFTSQVYNIENNYIKNISPSTSINLYKEYFGLENCHLQILDKNNNELTDGYVYTGSRTIIYDNNNNRINSYTNIITGDITSDGIVDNKDITNLAQYLIEKNNLEDYQTIAIDINNDNQIQINDLTLLENILNSAYQSITLNKETITIVSNEKERLIANLTPNIILNQNVIWTSDNESVATVSQSGIVTSKNEGTATITATTKDKKLTATSKITVDNTPVLSEIEGTAYVGGKNREVKIIKAVDYNDLTCKVADETKASCSIKDKVLIISPLADGNTTVILTDSKNNETTYKLTVIFPYFKIFYSGNCFITNSSYGGGVVSSMGAGTPSLFSISDREIVTNASISKTISLTTGSKTGDAEIIFTESNGNQKASVIAQVYKLSLLSNQGIGYVNGESLTTKITSSNTGDLSCSSNNSTIATCKIEADNLIVTPISKGQATITVTGSKCGNITYQTTIEDEVTP